MIIKTITTGDEPTAFCLATNTNRIYWANEWSHDISVLDATTDALISVIKYSNPPVTPVDICYNPLNNRIYTANRFKNQIGVINDQAITTNIIEQSGIHQPLKIFPIPVHDILYLNKKTKYAIWSVTGQQIIVSDKPSDHINIGFLKEGIYFIKAGNQSVQFIKN